MMKGDSYKENIHFETNLLKRDLDLLFEIFINAEKLANEKTKEARSEMKILEEQNNGNRQSSLLTENEEIAYDNFIRFGFHFNYLTLHSLFVSAYSFFENYLMTISKQLENHSYSNIKIKDVSKDKSDLDRLRKYLHLVHNLEFAKSNNEIWLRIVQFQTIRNAIVHNNNRFKDDNTKQQLILFLKKYEVHMPRSLFFHISDKNFLFDFNELVLLYSNELTKEIYEIV